MNKLQRWSLGIDLEKGFYQRQDYNGDWADYKEAADLIEQLEYFKDHMQEMVKANGFDSVAQLINKHRELAATVERFMSIHPDDRDLRDELLLVKKSTPQANLNAIKREASEQAEKLLFHCLFYAPSSPVKPDKATEIQAWYAVFKTNLLTKNANTKHPTTEGE